MKKELRKKLLYLIYELEKKNIEGEGAQKELKLAFEMLELLLKEDIFAKIEELWNSRFEGAPTKENLTIGLMNFDRQVRFLLIEENLI